MLDINFMVISILTGALRKVTKTLDPWLHVRNSLKSQNDNNNRNGYKKKNNNNKYIHVENQTFYRLLADSRILIDYTPLLIITLPCQLLLLLLLIWS